MHDTISQNLLSTAEETMETSPFKQAPLSIAYADNFQDVEGGQILQGERAQIALPATPVRYLYSGWQSWSLTAWVDSDRPPPPTRPSMLWPQQVDPCYTREKRPHGSWYGAVEMPNGQIIFLGALGLDSHVLLDSNSLRGWYEAGKGEWFLAYGEENEILKRYAALLEERFGKGRAGPPPRVWCSWYSLYTEIDERQLLKILTDLQDSPFDVFQIDDGWQIQIGDWEANRKFPRGMAYMATRIKESGRKAGLWLAPLLVAPSSSLYRRHRDWLLRDKRGRLVSAGFNWSEPLYALDTTHPEALAWLASLMQTVRAWGYDYLKLDFLYAGALPGQRYTPMPREAAYREGLKVIRQALGNAYLLTCGTPILPSLGLCDGMRIGPDVAEYWISNRDDMLLRNFTIPGGRNALRTTLHRLWLRPLVHTDPDVVYFRSQLNGLSEEQKSLLQNLAHICGFKATSDVPAWLNEEERQALRHFLEHQPSVERIGRYLWLVDGQPVDFAPHIALPPAPSPLANLQGALMGSLANVRLCYRFFEWISRQNLKNKLRRQDRDAT